MPPAPRVSVVVPSLDEHDNLAEVIPMIADEYEIIVVEGARYFRTEQLVRRLRPDAIIVEQTRYGKGNALACGFERATGDIVVTLDADGSADATEIPRFVAAIEGGADVAKGTRSRGGSDDITALRWLGNGALTALANLLFRTKYTDLCYGFNAFRREVVSVIDLPAPDPIGGKLQWGDGFEVEAILNCRIAVADLRVAEVPSHELKRIHGVSNLSAPRDGLRVLRSLLVERWRAKSRRTRLSPDPIARKISA